MTLPAQFLTASEFPDASTFAWAVKYVTPVHIEEPLPDTCDNSLGTQLLRDVSQAAYGSSNGPEAATETVYTYDTAAHAAQQFKLSVPACGGSGLSARTADGFGWAETGAGGTNHIVMVLHGNRIAALQYFQGPSARAYDSSHDAAVLATMLHRIGG